jgi:hypothetical protein
LSSAFAEAFPDALASLRTRLAEKKLEDEEVDPPNQMDTATLFTPDGQLCLPCVCSSLFVLPTVFHLPPPPSQLLMMSFHLFIFFAPSLPDTFLQDLWTKMTKKKPPKGCVDYVILTKERLGEVFSKENNNTGMERGFLSHPYVAEQFIKTHGTIQELAKFIQIIIKVRFSIPKTSFPLL